RLAELEAALAAPDVRAIVAARGGYGASRFVSRVDFGALAASPRWIVGFSDVTALHLEAQRVGVASMHAAHVTSLGRGDAHGRDAFVRALEHPTAARAFDALGVIARGAQAGPLVGGNLTLLHASAAAGRLDLPDGCVLFLEDVTERPYRIDRMLTTLALGGHLSRVGAVVLGDFTQCDPGADGVTVREVLVDRLAHLGVPVAYGLPAGHEIKNAPLVLGGPARLDATGARASLIVGDA
ncbi:MAG TPA: LD-carboxypeptidase, partial [Byssovorax sp.]